MTRGVLLVLACVAALAPVWASIPAGLITEPAQPAHRVPVGYSLDVFDRYGQMALLFKMLPVEQEAAAGAAAARAGHLYTGAARPVFAPRSFRTETSRRAGTFRPPLRFDFCRGSDQLLAALFSDVQIDGTAAPQRALVAGTPPRWIADRLGIQSMYLNSTFYYVLVRLQRPVQRTQLAGQPRVTRRFKRSGGGARDPADANRHLMAAFGTHFFSRFDTGDFVFQVYVYNPQTSPNLEGLFASGEAAPGALTGESRLFSPWYASHIGTVTLASAPLEFRQLVGPRLVRHAWFRRYQSLFLLLNSPALLRQTRQLSGTMVTGVTLQGLQHVIGNETLRKQFEEVVTNRFLLWELNL